MSIGRDVERLLRHSEYLAELQERRREAHDADPMPGAMLPSLVVTAVLLGGTLWLLVAM